MEPLGLLHPGRRRAEAGARSHDRHPAILLHFPSSMALESLVPPSATNLLTPETVLARLGLASQNLPLLTDIVEEASGLVTRFLRFQPAYGLWRETFTGHGGDRLYTSARPLWRVTGLSDRNGVSMEATTYRVDLQRHSLVRTLGWALDWANPWIGERATPINLLSPSDAWDWTAEYEAGWWLESMTGEPPAGVGKLAPEVRRDFVSICRWLWAQETKDPTIRRMRDEGSEVEYFAAGDVDQDTGIPCAFTAGLSYWRRPL